MTKSFITTLAYSEPAGSDRLGLCSAPADIHRVTVEPGTPREETVRVWDRYGDGPHLLLLGYDSRHPVLLLGAHLAGSAVRVEPVSPDLIAARKRAASGSCWHPDAVAVSALGEEVVAWLCPACDEALPADW